MQRRRRRGLNHFTVFTIKLSKLRIVLTFFSTDNNGRTVHTPFIVCFHHILNGLIGRTAIVWSLDLSPLDKVLSTSMYATLLWFKTE